MENRVYEFNVAVTASTQPDAGTPTLDNDVITKGYADDNLIQVPTITGTFGAPQAVVAGTGVLHDLGADDYFGMVFMQGSGGPVDVTNNPQVEAGLSLGQKITLVGASDINTVKLEDGTGLILNGECFFASGSVMELLWNGSNWIEISRNGV